MYKVQNYLNTHKNNSGFTLIEVLVALTIFSVGMLAIAALHITSGKGNASARIQTETVAWATLQMENLMSGSYHADKDGVDNDGDGEIDEDDERALVAGSHPESGSFLIRDGVYAVTWKVLDNQPVENTKTISVTAGHSGRGHKSVTITCVKADKI